MRRFPNVSLPAAIWLTAAVLIAGVVTVKVMTLRVYTHEIEQDALLDQRRPILLIPMQSQLNQMVGARISLDAFKSRMGPLNPERPVDYNPHYSSMRFYDPASDSDIVADFSDGEFSRWQSFPAIHYPDTHKWQRYSNACFLVAGIISIASIASLAGAVAYPRRRLILGQAMIAAALVCGTIRAAAKSRGHFMQVDENSIRVDVAFLAFGVVSLLPRFRRQMEFPQCKNCKYNLTGNTSGICPECGSGIPHHHKPDVGHPLADFSDTA